MKIKLIALLTVLLLLLTACAAPAPESESAPPPENLSDPEPIDVSHYYIEDPEREGIEDREAMEDLYWYLWGNLSPKDYSSIHTWWEWKDDAHEDHVYSVLFNGPDKAPIDALLRDYDGPYAPVWFNENPRTLFDLKRAEEDIRVFFEEHPETEMVDIDSREWEIMCNMVTVMEITDELTAFVENYPVKDIYEIMEYIPEEMINPD